MTLRRSEQNSGASPQYSDLIKRSVRERRLVVELSFSSNTLSGIVALSTIGKRPTDIIQSAVTPNIIDLHENRRWRGLRDIPPGMPAKIVMRNESEITVMLTSRASERYVVATAIKVVTPAM